MTLYLTKIRQDSYNYHWQNSSSASYNK